MHPDNDNGIRQIKPIWTYRANKFISVHYIAVGIIVSAIASVLPG